MPHDSSARFSANFPPIRRLGGGEGVALIFISAVVDPLLPSPLCSDSPENYGSGNLFSFGPIFPSYAFGAPIAGFFGHSIHIISPSVADTMSQRPISTFFGTLVQPCPRAKRGDVINTILYFRFQDRWTGKNRHEAYTVAQKACSTLFLNTPMATLCEFIRQAAVMARQDREVRCLPHEFLLMQPVVRVRWAAQLLGTWALWYFLSFTAPTNLHCRAPEAPHKPKKGTPNEPEGKV